MSHLGYANTLSRVSRKIALVIVAVLVAALLFTLDFGGSRRTVTVDFPQTVSLYVGSDVKVLGVPVGTVDSLEPDGEVVHATISYDDDVDLPADVKAVIVSPSIVGDRYVQFAPAYSGGPVLADDAHLDRERTAVPVELDEIYQSLDDLSVALGPEGANSDGALSSLLANSADQLDGQGAQLNETLRNLSAFTQTMAGNADNLFGSVGEINTFVEMLQANDDAVRRFNSSTADVAGLLADERDDLAGTLKTLGEALTDVELLVRDNRGTLRANVANLRSLSETLASRQTEFEELTVAAPSALANVSLAYNAYYGTLDVRADLAASLTDSILGLLTGQNGQPSVPGLLCMLLGQDRDVNGSCPALDPILGPLTSAIPTPGALGSVPSAGSVEEMLGVTP